MIRPQTEDKVRGLTASDFIFFTSQKGRKALNLLALQAFLCYNVSTKKGGIFL